jgi:NAD(P)H-flavin reductase
MTGPFGVFTYATDPRPTIFIAGGTGIAPIRSIIESFAGRERISPASLYWGSRGAAGLYIDGELHEYAARHSIDYNPVVSDPDDAWAGRTGLVHDAVLQDYSDLSAFDLYVCGRPEMVDAVRDAVIARGARTDRIFSDSFHPSKLPEGVSV